MDDDCAAGLATRRERVGLLGGRGLCCWVDDGCAAGSEGTERTVRRVRVGLLRWTSRWVGAGLESLTAGWERGGLLGGRGLCYWVGVTLTTVALLGGRELDLKG
jgi:hypothetical protein